MGDKYSFQLFILLVIPVFIFVHQMQKE